VLDIVEILAARFVGAEGGPASTYVADAMSDLGPSTPITPILLWA
jgi:hypothetical protein